MLTLVLCFLTNATPSGFCVPSQIYLQSNHFGPPHFNLPLMDGNPHLSKSKPGPQPFSLLLSFLPITSTLFLSSFLLSLSQLHFQMFYSIIPTWKFLVDHNNTNMVNLMVQTNHISF